jgi:hypothetical protein
MRNRVTPLGELIATPERGLVYGNRGCLHDAEGEIKRGHNGKRWIACQLQFRGRKRAPLRAPGRYTELFFLDEVTAFAAGHRPCAECRRGDYELLVTRWGGCGQGKPGADAIDAKLHKERIDEKTGERRMHAIPYAELPDGAMVAIGEAPWLVRGTEVLAWSPGGYGERVARPGEGDAVVITPPSLLALLRAGWNPLVPLMHPSAESARRNESVA